MEKKTRNHDDELIQLGGEDKKQNDKKQKDKKQNPYFEALQKLRKYITEDAKLTEGLGIPMSVQLNKLLKEGDKDYSKALDIYKKDKEGFKDALKKEIAARAKK